jgi:hypothetical protein
MTKEEKRAIAQIALPVLADYLEDSDFNMAFKRQAKRVINEIRYFDKMFMDNADIEVVEEQLTAQLAFRELTLKLVEDENGGQD